MVLQDMIAALNARVDDVVDTVTAVQWFNDAKNIMASKIGASFPDLDSTNMQSTFLFPVKYHILPVLYAAGVYKQYDELLNEAQMFMQQFQDALSDFTDRYELPEAYRDDRFSQQFTAVAGQTAFVVTKEDYDPSLGSLRVYVNGAKQWSITIPNAQNMETYQEVTTTTTTNNPYGFLLNNYTCNAGDLVTAAWDEHNDLLAPPYPWWNF